MNNPACAKVSAWLQAHPTGVPPESLLLHVSSCPLCRGGLLLLAHDQVLTSMLPENDNHDVCQDDLPAFVDWEQQFGSPEAMRAYPHVWWHLWFCGDCNDTYQNIQLLIQAEQDGLINPLRSSARRDNTVLFVPRKGLRRMVQSMVVLGTPWSGAPPAQLVAEYHVKGYDLALYIRHAERSTWSLRLVADPVPEHVTVRFATRSYDARFSVAGEAIVPAILLTDLLDSEEDIEITLGNGQN